MNINIPFPIVGQPDEFFSTITAVHATKAQLIGKIETRIGTQPYIIAARNAFDSAGLGKLKFYLQINDSYSPAPFDGSYSQWGAPEQEVYLATPIPVPQGGRVRVIVDNEDGANDFSATARVIVVYRSLTEALASMGYR